MKKQNKGFGIYTIIDRVAQMAISTVIELIFEGDVLDSAFGLRPKQLLLNTKYVRFRGDYFNVIWGRFS